jgi:hypothetical protein
MHNLLGSLEVGENELRAIASVRTAEPADPQRAF